MVTGANISFVHGDQKYLETSDLIVYATVKEIPPSYWLTPDGKEPLDLIYTTNPATGITHCKVPNGPFGFSETRNIIRTDIIFTVDYRAKGTSPDEITVCMYGGQVGDIVFEYNAGQYGDITFPAPWDFEAGEKYLLYLYSEDFGSYQMNTIDGI